MYGSITKNIWIIILLGIYSTVYGASTLPEPLHTLAHKSIDAVFREDFTKALNFAQDIIKTAPHRPAGYFFYAAVLNKQMEYEQSTRYENQFYKYCDKAIEVADKILDDRDDPWALFFKAGANGEKGTYESRYDKWITSFKHGWQAVQMLKDLVDAEKDFVDAYYGIATYNYWRTSKGKIMWWVPTGKDRRQAAVDTLYQMEKKGVYIRKNASLTLAYILVDYKKYRQALTVSQRFLQEYPHNLLGKWAELEALKGLKSYEELAKKGEIVRQFIEKKSFRSQYNYAYCLLLLTFAYTKLNNIDQMNQCKKVLHEIRLSSDDRKRLEKYFKEVENSEKK